MTPATEQPTTGQDLTTQGITRLKAGDKAGGQDLLLHAVTQQPTDLRAWLWLSGALADPAEQRYCLERVLACDPQHPAALRGLALLPAGSVARAPAALRERQQAAEFKPVASPAQPTTAPAAPPLEDQSGGPPAEQSPPACKAPLLPDRPLVTRPAEQPTSARKGPVQHAPQPSSSDAGSNRTSHRTPIHQTPALSSTSFLLVMIAGCGAMLNWAAGQGMGLRVPPAWIIAVSVALGPLFGLFSAYVAGVLLTWSGRRLGGHARRPAMWAALARATIPYNLALLTWLPRLVLLRGAAFEGPPTAGWIAALFFGLALVEVLALGWAVVNGLRALAAAHCFSWGHALASVALSLAIVGGVALAYIGLTVVLISSRGG